MERRKLPRTHIQTLVKLADGDHLHFGITANISKLGILCVVSTAQLSSGPLIVSFRLNNKARPLSIPATLAWQHSGSGRLMVGIAFDKPLDDSQLEIAGQKTGDPSKHHSSPRA